MRLTRAHADFYLHHLAPRFIRDVMVAKPHFKITVSRLIDDCVNQHAEQGKKLTSEPHNAVSLLASRRRWYEHPDPSFRTSYDGIEMRSDFENLAQLFGSAVKRQEKDRAKWCARFMRGLMRARARKSKEAT